MIIRKPFPPKYSLSSKRQIWVEKNFQDYTKLIPILSTINYEVPSLTDIITDITFYKVSNDDGKKTEIETLPFNMSLENQFTYYFMGGTVYDILNDNISGSNTELFLDSTGDIDVSIQIPHFKTNEVIEKKVIEYQNYFKNEDVEIEYSLDGFVFQKDERISRDDEHMNEKRLNVFYENYSRHLYERVLEKLQLEKMDSSFSNTIPFDFSNENYFDIDSSNPGFIDNAIGNAHLIRTCIDNNIKIQLVMKVEKNKTFVLNHIFEILIYCGNLEEIYKVPKIKYQSVNGINIQKIDYLVIDNFAAYLERKDYLGKDSFHKAINHVARLLYLLYLFKNYKNDDYVKQNINLFADTFLFQMDFFIKKMTRIDKRINKDNAFLFYYKIKKNNYEIEKIKIFTKTVVKAFIDVLYVIDNDGKIIKHARTNMDTYLFNGKRVSDIFQIKMSPPPPAATRMPFINSDYLKIYNLVFENIGRRKKRTVNTHLKITMQKKHSKSKTSRKVKSSYFSNGKKKKSKRHKSV